MEDIEHGDNTHDLCLRAPPGQVGQEVDAFLTQNRGQELPYKQSWNTERPK